MIPEKYYNWPSMKAREPYIAFERLMIIDCDLGVMTEEKTSNWMFERPIAFIMHHEHIQINVICLAYGGMDEARNDIIMTIMNSMNIFCCMTISDAITQEEFSQW